MACCWPGQYLSSITRRIILPTRLFGNGSSPKSTEVGFSGRTHLVRAPTDQLRLGGCGPFPEDNDWFGRHTHSWRGASTT